MEFSSNEFTFCRKLSGSVFAPTSLFTRNVFQSVCRCSIPRRNQIFVEEPTRDSTNFSVERVSLRVDHTSQHCGHLCDIGYTRNPSMNHHHNLRSEEEPDSPRRERYRRTRRSSPCCRWDLSNNRCWSLRLSFQPSIVPTYLGEVPKQSRFSLSRIFRRAQGLLTWRK